MVPLLQVEQLQISFQNGKDVSMVAEDISFTLFPNECLAIVGESGSGKSITALSIVQLLPPGSHLHGQITFAGEILFPSSKININTFRGKRIGMIFQEPMTSLNPLLTCGQQVMEVIQAHLHLNQKKAKEKTLELFALVELPDFSAMLSRYPHEISGGQKQRVMIAMALACDPQLLIADEPTTALDVSVQANILSLIKKISREMGLSVLLITHDLGVVADVADKVLVMQRGKVVEQGNCKQVLLHPVHPYTKGLLLCRPSNNDRSAYLPALPDILNGKYTTEKRPSRKVNNEPVLQIEKLIVQYVKRSALFSQPVFYNAVDDVSFSVNKNEIVGLVGESGCGKSTLAKSILQLVKSSSGKIILEGKDLTKVSPKEMRVLRKKIQVVFQDPYSSLNPMMKIGDAILEPLAVHKIGRNKEERKRNVLAMLEKLELLTEHYDRFPHEFSGGQRQRICIARALILQPSFVVFDESVSALDVSVQAQVLNLINRLKDEMDFSAIFISHDLSVVHYLCDRILVMQKGRIVESGEADAIYRHPQHPYTQMLVRAIPGKKFDAA